MHRQITRAPTIAISPSKTDYGFESEQSFLTEKVNSPVETAPKHPKHWL